MIVRRELQEVDSVLERREGYEGQCDLKILISWFSLVWSETRSPPRAHCYERAALQRNEDRVLAHDRLTAQAELP